MAVTSTAVQGSKTNGSSGIKHLDRRALRGVDAADLLPLGFRVASISVYFRARSA